MSYFKRFHAPKKWSQIYVDAAEEQRECYLKLEENLAKQRNENMNSIMARNFVAKNLGRIVRNKLKTKTFSVRTTLNNIEEPEENDYEWDTAFVSQACCDVCIQPCANNTVKCSQCPVTYHRNCVNSLFPGKKKRFKDVADMDEKAFMCFNCMQGNQEDEAFYTNRFHQLEMEQHSKNARRILSDFIVAFLVRAKFLKTRNKVVKFQAQIRRKFQRRRFLKIRREKPFVVKVGIKAIPSIYNLDAHHDSFGYGRLVLTCVDTMRGQQHLRFEKPIEEAIAEGFIIPGVTQSFSIVITAIKHLDLYGQVQIALRDLSYPYRPKELVQEAGTRVPFPPTMTDVNSSSTHQWNMQVLTDCYQGWLDRVERKERDDREDAWGSTQQESIGGNGKHGHGHHHGHKAKSANSVSRPVTSHNRHASNGIHRAQHTSSEIAIETATFTFSYRPVSSLKSLCGPCNGPSLDILRKAADNFSHLKNVKEVKRASRYWISLTDLKLRFYAFYGDSQCRIESDLTHASVTNVGNLVTIKFEDKRLWQIEFDTPGEAATMTFVVRESKTPMYLGVPRKRKPF